MQALPAIGGALLRLGDIDSLLIGCSAMTDKTSESTKTGLKAIWFTLIGVVITAGISWSSTYQAASVDSRKSCLARLDAKESIIRGKAETFFASIGNLTALASHRARDNQEYDRRIDAVVVAAFSLSPYLDRKTYETPKLIAQRVAEMFYSNKSEKDIKKDEQNSKVILELLNKWTDEYNALMDAFESAKEGC